ncbi:MAG: xanthine dehydrogenase small subunit [Woeseia sp.]
MSTATGTVRFVLDGEIVAIDNPDPTRTVLQYLREDLRRIGTKEGCAEGDCGACTVALAEVDRSGARLQIRAINSCIQFLATLDGKELITVESLRGSDGSLHPVQQAMVDCHGSQCGFCTPGFVMSMFVLFKNNARPTRRDIDDALAGNLCRCTGYSPIIKAATDMYALAARRTGQQSWLLAPCAPGNICGSDERARKDRLVSIAHDETLEVAWRGRRFIAPRTLADLAESLRDHPQATLLAGGTDVGLWVTKELREIETLIYTGAVLELREITTSKTHLEIGAAVPLTDAMPAILAHWPDLEELLLRFASPPIRNAGTLGGNVANGSPIGDSMPALLALDASLVLTKFRDSDPGLSQRSLSLKDFYIDYRNTAREPGEVLERIRLPLPVASSQLRSFKVSKRFDQDISAVCGAYYLELDGNRVAVARLAYGGMAAIPKRAEACEQALIGREWNVDSVHQAMSALEEDFSPVSDMRASARYRRAVARNLLMRFYLETTAADSTRVYNYGRQSLA